jgi:hypothetical protein
MLTRERESSRRAALAAERNLWVALEPSARYFRTESATRGRGIRRKPLRATGWATMRKGRDSRGCNENGPLLRENPLITPVATHLATLVLSGALANGRQRRSIPGLARAHAGFMWGRLTEFRAPRDLSTRRGWRQMFPVTLDSVVYQQLTKYLLTHELRPFSPCSPHDLGVPMRVPFPLHRAKSLT